MRRKTKSTAFQAFSVALHARYDYDSELASHPDPLLPSGAIAPMMHISERYRLLADEVAAIARALAEDTPLESPRPLRQLSEAATALAEMAEAVGEIPRIQLEAKLTPILLKSHSQLDRARLLLDEEGQADRAASVWELEQKIYRLLNDL
jgi:hypothetical protein